MSSLTTSSPVSNYSDAANYTIARLEAHPDGIAFAPLLQAPIDQLIKVNGDADKNAIVQTKLRALRDARHDTLTDAYELFALQSAAHFGSDSAPGHLRVVAVSPAQFARVALKSLPLTVAEFKSAVDDAATPAEIKKLAKPVYDAWDAHAAAQAKVAAGALTTRKFVKALENAKIDVLTGLAKVRAALGGIFPRKPKIVARFFLKSKAKHAKDDADVGSPDANP